MGCLLIGVTRSIYSKLPVEFAFMYAWPRWAPARNFPIVRGGPERNDIWRLLQTHDRRTSAWFATWVQQDSSLYPETRNSWETEEAADAIAEHSGVSAAGWVELAELFVSHLKTEEYSRSDA